MSKSKLKPKRVLDRDPKKCGAVKTNGQGFCKGQIVRGGTRCRMHGGTKQRLPKGDPRRGGRPPVSGYYAKYLPKDMLVDYANAKLGTLDAEIQVAKAHLARVIRLWGENPTGGWKYNVNGTMHFTTYESAVLVHQENVRRLESARAQYNLIGGDQGHAGVILQVQAVDAIGLPDTSSASRPYSPVDDEKDEEV